MRRSMLEIIVQRVRRDTRYLMAISKPNRIPPMGRFYDCLFSRSLRCFILSSYRKEFEYEDTEQSLTPSFPPRSELSRAVTCFPPFRVSETHDTIASLRI